MWEILCSIEYERELRNDLVSEVSFYNFYLTVNEHTVGLTLYKVYKDTQKNLTPFRLKGFSVFKRG